MVATSITTTRTTATRTAARRRRVLVENLQAYLFAAPALLLIFIFGLFPVAFAFFVSLHRWRRFPGEYQGLTNYANALGDFAYVLFFWLAFGAFGYAAWLLYRQARQEARGLLALIPGAVNTAALLLFVQWSATLLPIILNIPQRIRGQERVPGLFMNELFASFRDPVAAEAGNVMLLVALAALIASLIWLRLSGATSSESLLRGTIIPFLGACAILIFQLLTTEIARTVIETEGQVSVWIQAILISLGAVALVGAWLLWQGSGRVQTDRRFIVQAAAALMLAAAGYLLITYLPIALGGADDDLLSGFSVTAMFVIGVVPLQLAIGLGLAYLLFQNIKGKAFFRVAYFVPYIMPFAATAIVFNILFAYRSTSPINQLLTTLGIPVQKWLLEPTGIFQLIFGDGIPDWLAGPSLALVVIILYTVWTYIGYCTVVFLAGLGNISPELYEAARIDGASGWDIFRRITLPLLSPTTFFLSLIAIIGTFQAFTQIYIMRTPAAAQSVDTVGVVIFETVRSTDPNMGYASALSLVLFIVIIIFTLVQQRYARDRVFYG